MVCQCHINRSGQPDHNIVNRLWTFGRMMQVQKWHKMQDNSVFTEHKEATGSIFSGTKQRESATDLDLDIWWRYVYWQYFVALYCVKDLTLSPPFHNSWKHLGWILRCFNFAEHIGWKFVPISCCVWQETVFEHIGTCIWYCEVLFVHGLQPQSWSFELVCR